MTEEQVAEHWVKQIDHILNKDVRFALRQRKKGAEILEGIKADVEEKKRITKRQIQAIKNIRFGKDELRQGK